MPVGSVGDVIAEISGAVVKISGEHVYVESGAVVLVSGQVVQISGQHVYLESGATIIVQISGLVVEISGEVVQISGQHIYQESGAIVLISGQTITQASGAVVLISGQTITQASGAIVLISGQHLYQESGAVVLISGQTVITTSGLGLYTPTEVKTGPVRIVTAASGGMVLHSGTVISLKVKAMLDNSGDIYVGGATQRPYSGFGFCLDPGDTEAMDLDDFHAVYVVATVSGDQVTFDGVL